MASTLPYDITSAASIFEYSKGLLGGTLRPYKWDGYKPKKGKGSLGQMVENLYFLLETNSNPAADFSEAGLELKCTPLKLLADNSMAAKERLVLNIINYIEEAEKSFETSSFWHKNKFLLLMFYLHQSGVNPVDILFKLVRTWKSNVNLPMLSNKYLYRCLMRLVSVLLLPLQGMLSLGTCQSNKFQILDKSTLGSLAYGNMNIRGAIQSHIHRLCLQVRLAYEVLQQKALKVFAGHSLLYPPHVIFIIKEKLSLADTRIIAVAQMLKTTMLRVEIPPMCGNYATAYTHPAFVFNIGMGNQEFAEFNRCNPIHRK